MGQGRIEVPPPPPLSVCSQGTEVPLLVAPQLCGRFSSNLNYQRGATPLLLGEGDRWLRARGRVPPVRGADPFPLCPTSADPLPHVPRQGGETEASLLVRTVFESYSVNIGR